MNDSAYSASNASNWKRRIFTQCFSKDPFPSLKIHLVPLRSRSLDFECVDFIYVDFQQEIPWFHLVPLCSAASDTQFPPVVDGAFLDTPISNFSLETVNVFQQAEWSAAVPIWRSNFSGYAGRSLSLWVSTALVPEHGFLAYRPARIKLCTTKSIHIHITSASPAAHLIFFFLHGRMHHGCISLTQKKVSRAAAGLWLLNRQSFDTLQETNMRWLVTHM